MQLRLVCRRAARMIKVDDDLERIKRLPPVLQMAQVGASVDAIAGYLEEVEVIAPSPSKRARSSGARPENPRCVTTGRCPPAQATYLLDAGSALVLPSVSMNGFLRRLALTTLLSGTPSA